ncbi:MAG: phage baseplate assembly protein V, partial [Thermoanaerobaculia bacterium]
VGRLARAKLSVRNWKDLENEIKHSDAVTFAPGTEIEIQLGYNQEFETVFDGLITELVGAFGPTGEPVLIVHCRCRGSLLTGIRRSRVFEDKSDKDAVAEIAGAYGLDPEVGDGPTYPSMVMYDSADWDFLVARARALGWALYVRGKRLVLGPAEASGSPVTELEWGATLLEVEVSQNPAERAARVIATGWDPETLEPTTSEQPATASGFPEADRPSVDQALKDAGWPERETRHPRPTPLAADELDGDTVAVVEGDALSHISGRGRAIGLPQIRIDSLLELKGLGTRFSGAHYVTAVRHLLSTDGYFTEFQLGRPPRLGSAEAGRRDHLVPPATDLAIGVVDDIDDQNGWGRVKVRLPWLDDAAAPIWARLVRPDAGPKRGFYFIPEVGDEVVIGFLGSDPRQPIVLGGLWNGQHAAPEQLDAATNPIRAIVSRSGHRVVLDDSDGAGKITLKSAAGQTVVIDDSSGAEKIELEDKTGNTLTLDSGGIALTAAAGADVAIAASTGAIKLDASEIQVTSTGPAAVKSSAALDLQAAATLGISGAVVKINS